MKIKTAEAIDHFKGVAGLAAALQISRAAIYQWGEFVPEARVYQLHILSQMALPRQPVDPRVPADGAAA